MMYWKNLSDFMAMGGYGLYVWGSFFLTFALILIEILYVKKARQAIQTALQNEIDEAAKN